MSVQLILKEKIVCLPRLDQVIRQAYQLNCLQGKVCCTHAARYTQAVKQCVQAALLRVSVRVAIIGGVVLVPVAWGVSDVDDCADSAPGGEFIEVG